MDIVFLEGLEIETVIGAYDWERNLRQRLVIDLDLEFNCRTAGGTDLLTDALDYASVAAAVTQFVESSRFELLEALAEHTAALLMKDFRVTWLRLRIGKPGAVKNAKTVGVSIERGKQR